MTGHVMITGANLGQTDRKRAKKGHQMCSLGYLGVLGCVSQPVVIKIKYCNSESCDYWWLTFRLYCSFWLTDCFSDI